MLGIVKELVLDKFGKNLHNYPEHCSTMLLVWMDYKSNREVYKLASVREVYCNTNSLEWGYFDM